MSGSGISWTMCKSAPRSRQITTPAPHHSVFLQTGCRSCHPTNTVKALKAQKVHDNASLFLQTSQASLATSSYWLLILWFKCVNNIIAAVKTIFLIQRYFCCNGCEQVMCSSKRQSAATANQSMLSDSHEVISFNGCSKHQNLLWTWTLNRMHRKSVPSAFYWSKRQWLAVAGTYANLHIAPDK